MLKSPFWILKSLCVMRNCQFLLDKHPQGTADFVRLLRVLGGLWKLVRGILNAAYTLIVSRSVAHVRLDEVSSLFRYFFLGVDDGSV